MRISSVLTASTVSLFILCSTAKAQTSTGDLALEEVVITAQKREETLQKAALSIVALDGDELREEGKTNMIDMLRGVAGVETGGGYFFVRGIGSAPVFGQDASVTVSMNGVFMQNGQTQRDAFYDIARVEVARGPQTTLTGRTSEGGAVNVITNEPALNKWEINGVAEGGDHHRIAGQAVVNVPLGSIFALRLAGSHVQKDGYFTSGGDTNNNSGRVRFLIQPNDDIKLILSGDYSRSKIVGTFSGATGRIDLTQPFYTLNGNYWNPTPPYSVSAYTVKNFWGDFSWNMPVGVLYFQPTYQATRNINYPGYNTNPVTLYNNLTAGQSYDTALAQATTWNSSVSPSISRSFELRFSNPVDSNIKWLLGAYYFHYDQAIALLNGGAGTTSLPIASYPVVYPQSSRRVTIDKDAYFQITVPFVTTWRATAGARYSNDSKERGNAIGGYVLPDGTAINTNLRFPIDNNTANPGVTNGTTAANGPFIYYDLSPATISYKRINWLAKIEHDFTGTSMGYAMVSTGWKNGSFINLPNTDATCPTTPRAGAPSATACSSAVPLVTAGFRTSYDPEYMTAYEIGSKNTLFNDKLRLNGALYYYDYKGFQFNYAVNWINPATRVDPDYQPLTGQTGNAKKAVSYGGEIESGYLITQHDRFDLNVSYIHARLKSLQVSSLAAQSVKTWAASLEGFPFPHAPTWQIKPKYVHVFDLPSGNVNASIDAQISTKQYTTLPSNCQQVPGVYAAGQCTTAALTVDNHVLTYYTQPGFTKINLSVGYHSPNDKWGVTGYMNNATNKKTIQNYTAPNSFTGFGNVTFTPDDPRTYGVIVTAAF